MKHAFRCNVGQALLGFFIIASIFVCTEGTSLGIKRIDRGLLSQLAFQEESSQRDSFPSSQLSDSFGFNLQKNSGTINDADWVESAGSKLVRLPMMWWEVETRSGQYDFSSYDPIMESFRKQGIRPVICLAFGNPLYGDSWSVRGPNAIAAFANFAQAAAARYRANDVIWEIWNEPNLASFWRPQGSDIEYMALLRATVPAIRQADPTALVIGPALANTTTPFLAACIRAGLLDLVDGVSVHPYQAKLYPEALANDLHTLSGWIQRYKPADRTIPILFTEWGYSSASRTELERGNFLIREALVGVMNGIPVNIWFNFRNKPGDCNSTSVCYGILSNDFIPFPAYERFSAFSKDLAGFKFSTRLEMGNKNVYCLLFVKGDARKLVAWTTELYNDSNGSTANNIVSVTLPNGIHTELSGTPAIYSW
jgi:hypothetical protein